MFTKNFNLSENLIDTATKLLKESSKKIDEASNEEPNINHLELSEEELNELSTGTLKSYVKKVASTPAGMAKPSREKGIETASKKLRNEETNEEVMPKGMSMKERTAFHMAAAAASKAGKSHFEFGGKKFKTTMQKDVAHKMTEEENRIQNIKALVAEKLNEARKAKNADYDDSDEDPEGGSRPSEHIMNQLRKASMTMKREHPVKYSDGKTGMVDRHVAKALVNHYNSLPKAHQKETMQAEIGKSHKHLTNYYNRSNATNEEMQTHSRQKIRTGSFVKITSSRDPNKHEIVGFKPGSDSSGNLDSYTVRAHLRKPHSKTVFTPVSSTRDVAASTIHKLNSLEESMYDPNLGKNKQTLVEKKPKKMNEVPVETMKQVKMVHREEAVDTDPNTGKKIHKKVKIHKEEIDENLKVGSMVRVTNPKATPKHKIIGVEGDKYHIEKPDGTKIHLSKERIHKINAIKEEQIDEREMTSDEKAKREKIVMALKKKMAGFKERYGERAKDVMYATATKQAMKEEDEAAPKGKTMTGEKKDGVDVKPEMINRGASGVKSTTT